VLHHHHTPPDVAHLSIFFRQPCRPLQPLRQRNSAMATPAVSLHPLPISIATPSRDSMTFTSTKGLLNGPGQNNCFLNSAVQVGIFISLRCQSYFKCQPCHARLIRSGINHAGAILNQNLTKFDVWTQKSLNLSKIFYGQSICANS
jgi:ferredoxin